MTPEAHVAALEQELEALRHTLQERDDLLAFTAHELRNPLHGLWLQLRLARMAAEACDPDGTLARLAKAEVMVERYVARLNVMLDLARLNERAYPLALHTVDLGRTLASLADTLEPEAEFRHVAMRLELPERLEAYTDPTVIEQAVGNLMLNAFKHAACRQVTLALREEGEQVSISVQDDGRGIAPEDQQRIFGKFQVGGEVRAADAGTGLGLWIVRKLVAALGGSLELHSRPGEGSRFTLKLPKVHRAIETA